MPGAVRMGERRQEGKGGGGARERERGTNRGGGGERQKQKGGRVEHGHLWLLREARNRQREEEYGDYLCTNVRAVATTTAPAVSTGL